MAGLAVVAPVAVPIIFGEQWLPSVILIQLLTVVGLLRSIGNPVGSLLLAKGRADLGFKWNVAVMITQISGLYLGAKLGGVVGVAIAFVMLQTTYKMFGYPFVLRQLLGPFLREYVSSMWPSLWMSAVMAGTVLCVELFLQNSPQQFLLIMQVICGAVVYLGLIIYNQKMFVFEIKDMIWNRRIS
ncbi:MAG: polysaccharide biosynthesis C-terminal domain-containing protein [Desulfobacula sp.]|nr:polysaccharide biosynthesis C-terminal domain-containing protein [Desulfobacula sp.]